MLVIETFRGTVLGVNSTSAPGARGVRMSSLCVLYPRLIWVLHSQQPQAQMTLKSLI